MAILNRFTRAERESIYSGANAAVWHSHRLANESAKHTPREEDYVATLVTDAIPFLVKRWGSLLGPKGIELKVSGVFCHGHPQVAFGAPKKRVELADLLVVHQHATKHRTRTRAVLVQAKTSIDATHRLPAGDPQLELFSTWPRFEFVTGGLTPGLRNLKEVGKGSRYALVHAEFAYPEVITWADQCPWAACSAGQLLSAELSFARLLGDMLFGKDGRVVRIHSPRDDWSRTIKELLEVTGKKTYRRANIGRGNAPRGSTSTAGKANLMFFAQSPSFLVGGGSQLRLAASERFFGSVSAVSVDGLSDDPPRSEQRDGGGGMSTLILETRDRDQ